MSIAKLSITFFFASMLVGCPPDTSPVEPAEPEVIIPTTVEPEVTTCNEGLCVKERMPECLAQAEGRINKNTVISWLEICEKPPIALSDVVDGMQGKTTGCFICIDELNQGYLTWRHQFHQSHGVENCQEQ